MEQNVIAMLSILSTTWRKTLSTSDGLPGQLGHFGAVTAHVAPILEHGEVWNLAVWLPMDHLACILVFGLMRFNRCFLRRCKLLDYQTSTVQQAYPQAVVAAVSNLQARARLNPAPRRLKAARLPLQHRKAQQRLQQQQARQKRAQPAQAPLLLRPRSLLSMANAVVILDSTLGLRLALAPTSASTQTLGILNV